MQLFGSLIIFWHCSPLGLEWKLTFSSPVATAEFSKSAGIMSQQWNIGIQVSESLLSNFLSSFLFLKDTEFC